LQINQTITPQKHITLTKRRKRNIFFSTYTARKNNL